VTDKTLTIKTKYNFFVITIMFFPSLLGIENLQNQFIFKCLISSFDEISPIQKKAKTFTFCNLFGTQLRPTAYEVRASPAVLNM